MKEVGGGVLDFILSIYGLGALRVGVGVAIALSSMLTSPPPGGW